MSRKWSVVKYICCWTEDVHIQTTGYNAGYILANVIHSVVAHRYSRWRHQWETFSALLALCAWNSPVIGEFPAQGPVTRSFNIFFDLCLNKQLSKKSWGWWFETQLHSLWRHSYVRLTDTGRTRSISWLLMPRSSSIDYVGNTGPCLPKEKSKLATPS